MKKRYIVLMHIIIWLLLFIVVNNFIIVLGELLNKPHSNLDIKTYIKTFSITMGFVIPFYTGYIVTSLYQRKIKKSILFMVVLAICIVMPIVLYLVAIGSLIRLIDNIVYMISFQAVFFIIGVSFRSLFGWIEQRKLNDKLKEENLRSELTLLRSQLNPHFLFNTLNNIDTLIGFDQAKASDALIKLSSIMRYMLYQNKTDKVPFTKELLYIENYIELEKLRFKNPAFLNFSINCVNRDILIQSMIFIPFIENAFKHSVDSDIENGIVIRFNCDNNKIIFSCKNVYSVDETDKDGVHGIGLSTVKRRLKLMYPDRHRLQITTSDNRFNVELEIDI